MSKRAPGEVDAACRSNLGPAGPDSLPVGVLVMRYYAVTFPCLPVLGFRLYGQELPSRCSSARRPTSRETSRGTDTAGLEDAVRASAVTFRPRPHPRSATSISGESPERPSLPACRTPTASRLHWRRQYLPGPESPGCNHHQTEMGRQHYMQIRLLSRRSWSLDTRQRGNSFVCEAIESPLIKLD